MVVGTKAEEHQCEQYSNETQGCMQENSVVCVCTIGATNEQLYCNAGSGNGEGAWYLRLGLHGLSVYIVSGRSSPGAIPGH